MGSYRIADPWRKRLGPAIPDLKAALKDPSPNVVVVVSEALFNLGETDMGRSGFEAVLKTSNSFARTHVLNAIESVDDDSEKIQEAVILLAKESGEMSRRHYDHRSAKVLLDKWGIDPEEHGISSTW